MNFSKKTKIVYVVEKNTILIFLRNQMLLSLTKITKNTTQFIPNCKSFDFFNIKFDHSSYSKFCTKYHSFLLCIGLLIKVLQE